MTSFRRLTVVAVVATFTLIAIGGLVRATESGLGCGTDWPDCSGELVPGFQDRAQVIEYSHRVAASLVVMVLGALALLALVRLRDRPALVRGALGAFGLVLFQAALGMVVVKLELHAGSVVLHLAAALSLLALLVHLLVRSRTSETAAIEHDPATARRAGIAAAAVLGLLLLGSYLSGVGAEYHAGFPDWPLIGGRLIPDLSDQVIALHWLHRVAAVAVGVVVFAVAIPVIRDRRDRPGGGRIAHAVAGLFALEVMIGAANVWFQGRPVLGPGFVTAHLATGAAIWALLVAMASLAAAREAPGAVEPPRHKVRAVMESAR